ncbi:MAG: gamma-glutamyltransferase [Ilumatobacteraceae bacterium]
MTIRTEHAVMAEQCTGRGRNGVVCAAAPLAALAGAEALRAGGNAFDAAVTAALCETVLLPPKCGMGGDLVALALRSPATEPDALLAIGGASAGLAAVAATGIWRDVGANAVGPPAAPAGYEALARLGRLGRARLAAPAIDLAVNGFPWAAVCTRLAEQAAALVAEMNPGGTSYFPGGTPIAPATLTRLPGLAAVLQAWVDDGAGLLDGPIGAAVVDAVRRRGGVLTTADLAGATAEWRGCATARIGRRTLWATPAPTHGAALVRALGERDSAAEAYRRVLATMAARDQSLADPSGTSMVSAVDAEGNAVVVVHSNSYPRFGSGIVVEEYQLVLANRAGRGFTPTPGHPNFPVAGRRPATTLHAWAVDDGAGRVRLLGATPGGANQLPWNAQVLRRVLDGCEAPGVLVTAPLWEILADGGLRLEDGFTADEREGLSAVADAVTEAPRWGCKSAIQVVRLARPGEVHAGAADPRTQGSALGV